MLSLRYIFVFVVTAFTIVSANDNGVQLVENAVLQFVPCFLKDRTSQCLENSTRRALDTWSNVVEDQWNELVEKAAEETSRDPWSNRALYDTPKLARSLRRDISRAYDVVTNYLESDSEPDNEVGTGRAKKPDKNKQSVEEFPDDEFDDSPEAYADAFSGSKSSRGKKKKQTKLMALFLIGALIKSKIELLLKLFNAHMQMKFLAVAVVGLLINIARFFLDLKKAHDPQKVVYHEHAKHEHYYDHQHVNADDHKSGWGSWWGKKRSLDSAFDTLDAQQLAYAGYKI